MGEKYRATAFIGEHGKPVQIVMPVRVISESCESTLYEDSSGRRSHLPHFVEFEALLPTQEAAELWCAERLEAEVAPTLALIATLREQAAARVAQREVVSV